MNPSTKLAEDACALARRGNIPDAIAFVSSAAAKATTESEHAIVECALRIVQACARAVERRQK